MGKCYIHLAQAFMVILIIIIHITIAQGGLFVCLLACPTKGKDIVFRFIIEYSSSRDFGP
jgi:hypothetical protein